MHLITELTRIANTLFKNKRINIDEILISEVSSISLPNVFMDLYQHQDVSQCLDDIRTWNFAASYKGKYCGFVELVEKPDQYFPFSGYWIHGLYIKKGFRRTGIGQLLLQKLIETARNEKMPHLCILVNKSNTPAISLYSKHCFKREADDLIETQIISRQPLFEKHSLMTKKLEYSRVLPKDKNQ